jgi:hypothetical protein
MQAIEDSDCHDTTISLGHSRHGLFLPETLVWPSFVIKAGVRRDEAQKMASPSTRTWSSNSRRRVPTKRSAKAFMFGFGPRCERPWLCFAIIEPRRRADGARQIPVARKVAINE